MAIERFATATTPAPLVFCDANFLYDIAVGASKSLQRAVPRRVARAQIAAAFFRRYQGNRTRFISSPHALEEVFFSFAKTVLNPTGYTTWKDLQKADATLYSTTRAKALALALSVWQILRNDYNIEVSTPRVGGGAALRSVVNRQVIDRAVDFYKLYPLLDWADATHLAMALACGARWIATSDTGFHSATVINFFAD